MLKVRKLSPAHGTLLLAILALPVLAGLVEAVRGAWLCDDIFITFRYIDQFERGHGLVFNPGEAVEGYSHFMWLLLLAALHRLGPDLQTLGRYLPTLSWLAVLAILFFRAARTRSNGWMGLPVAAWGLALHKDAQVFASSGMETSFFGLLLLLGLLCVTREKPRYDLAACIYAAASLVRPEGVLYAISVVAYVAWRERRVGSVVRFAGLWFLLALPFEVWRLVYYGEWLPNTYYAKSAGQAYWSQGWQYTRLYFSVYPVLLLSLAAAAIAWTRPSRPHEIGSSRDLVMLAFIQVILTIVYVTRVGGDFMFARFYVPTLPLVYLVGEEAVRRAGRPGWMVVLGVTIVGFTLFARSPRDRIFVGPARVHGVANEVNVYTPAVMQDLHRQGNILGRVLGGTEARIALPPGRSMLAFLGNLPYAIEGSGLTDAEIARTPVQERSRPGHEKVPSMAYLHRQGVQFRLLYGAHRAAGLRAYEVVRFEDLYAQMIFYDRNVMETLAKDPNVQFIRFTSYLDRFLDEIDQYSASQLQDEYDHFRRFYFQHNDDPVRLWRLQAALRSTGVGRVEPMAP